MLVFDTAELPRQERAEAFQASVSQNCTASAAVFIDPGEVQAEVHAYDLGRARVLTIDASGTTLRRTPRMARAADDSSVALALPLRASNHMLWEREDRVFGPRDLILVDLAAPYVYRWPDGGASYALHVDLAELDVPMDAVRTAARQLRTSPLYELVRDHVARLTTDAHRLVDGGAATSVGGASVELMRALIVSAAGDARRLEDAMQRSLGPRVDGYVTRHLRDSDLTPSRIAAAHGISLRVLYGLFEARGTSLEQTIIVQRLRAARIDLAAPGQAHRTVAAVARSWGFSSPSFFAARFRQAFGVTPTQWRAGVATVPAQRSTGSRAGRLPGGEVAVPRPRRAQGPAADRRRSDLEPEG